MNNNSIYITSLHIIESHTDMLISLNSEKRITEYVHGAEDFGKNGKLYFLGKIHVNIRIGAIIIILFQIYTSTRYKYFVFGWGPSYLGFIGQSFAYALFFFKQTEGF